MHVTQATLSRDLDELGVVRLRAADGTLVYALPGDPGGHGSLAGTSLAGTAIDRPAVRTLGRRPEPPRPPAPRPAPASGQAPADGPAAGQAAARRPVPVAAGREPAAAARRPRRRAAPRPGWSGTSRSC